MNKILNKILPSWVETFNEWAIDVLGLAPTLFFKVCVLLLLLIELERETGHKPWMKVFIILFGLLWMYQDIGARMRQLDNERVMKNG